MFPNVSELRASKFQDGGFYMTTKNLKMSPLTIQTSIWGFLGLLVVNFCVIFAKVLVTN